VSVNYGQKLSEYLILAEKDDMEAVQLLWFVNCVLFILVKTGLK